MEYTDILNINLFDCAGYGISHKKGFDKHSALKYRMISYKSWNFFENDIVLGDMDLLNYNHDNINLSKILLDTSEIVQFNPVISHGEFSEIHADNPNGIIYRDGHLMPGPIKWTEEINNKKKFILFNGSTNLLNNQKEYYDIYKSYGFKILFSTPGYQKVMSDGIWCPYIPSNDESFWNSNNKYVGLPIKICHSSTNDKIKNTEDLIDSVSYINNKFNKKIYDLKIIRYMPWNECIKIKKECQINFDHMQGYCGIASVEASKIGMINIVGVSDDNIKLMNNEIGGFDDCPWFLPKNKTELIDCLIKIKDIDINKHIIKTKKWANEIYNQEKLTKRMENIYKS
jgi:hypothetical protein